MAIYDRHKYIRNSSEDNMRDMPILKLHKPISPYLRWLANTREASVNKSAVPIYNQTL